MPNGGPPRYGQQPAYPQGGGYDPHAQHPEQPRGAVPPNYGAPANWRPAIMPRGQSWPPAKWDQDPSEEQSEDRDQHRPPDGR